MKMFITGLASMILFSTSLAYGAPPADDLVGLWKMAMDVAKADNDKNTYTFFDPDHPTDPETGYQYFVITSQDQNLFKGHACTDDPDIERSYFSGALDGKNIYTTSWDSLSFGTVNNALTEMNITNLHQSLDEGTGVSVNNSSTARVVAARVNSEPDAVCPPPPTD